MQPYTRLPPAARRTVKNRFFQAKIQKFFHFSEFLSVFLLFLQFAPENFHVFTYTENSLTKSAKNRIIVSKGPVQQFTLNPTRLSH